MNQDFWRRKRVLVTGHTGFKGSWLSLWLSQLGAEVTGYSLAPEASPSNFEVCRVGERIESIEGNVCDLEALKRSVAGFQPEIVFHLAAQSLVRKSYSDPVETFQTNVLGTVNVLEAVRQTPSAKAVIVVTSDKCYENREWVWGYREADPLGGHDPYSSSKGCAEIVAAAYRASYFSGRDGSHRGAGIATARAGNVIGGGDWSRDRLVPDALHAHANSRELVIRNPGAVRPWQFVLEPLCGYMALAESMCADGGGFSEAWNFGPGENDVLSVETIVQSLSDHLKGGLRYRIVQDRTLHEANLLKLDCSKVRARLGWRPRTTIHDALKLTADWHTHMLSGSDMQAVSIAQISSFQQLTTGR